MLEKNSDEILKMATTKHISWQYEQEWRAFHKEPDKLFGYPAAALTGVYFGAAMDFTHSEVISLIIQGQNPNVQFYETKKSATKFAVEIKPVNYMSFLEAQQRGLR